MTYCQIRHSPPRAIVTIFGPAMIEGPFIDDYTDLKWQFKEFWWGETARFQVAGLEAFAQDCDGDRSWWQLTDVRTGAVVAKGDHIDVQPLHHFWMAILDAEKALRDEVARRKTALSAYGELPPHGETK